jgi:enamine deaminase RidA (YjgF/YER057c/UK114 family)
LLYFNSILEDIMSIDARLTELGITLPEMPRPMGNYVSAVRTGNLLYLSGKGPLQSRGKVGAEVSSEAAYNDAREVGLLLLSVMQHELGSLDRVKQVVKALGMVNAVPEFGEHPKVINGFSDLMVEVFGDRGRHARSAVGMGSLPNQITVEIEVIVEVS